MRSMKNPMNPNYPHHPNHTNHPTRPPTSMSVGTTNRTRMAHPTKASSSC